MTVATEPPQQDSAPPVLDVRTRNIVFVTIMLGVLLSALDHRRSDGPGAPG
ncbi:hypothetical protein [Streptomyces sp. NPDC003952]